MRIGILGVGAIGGVIGGYLARAGRDVTLIDMWPANVERIKADGLKVTAIEGVFTAKAPPSTCPRSRRRGPASTSPSSP